MKQFIVLVAVVPLMLIMIMQIGHAQINMSKAAALERTLTAAEEIAKQDGCFTEAVKTDMVQSFSSILGLKKEEIDITATGVTNVKYRRCDYASTGDMIHYTVVMPFKEVMAAPGFFGIRKENNQTLIKVDRYIASEKLKP